MFVYLHLLFLYNNDYERESSLLTTVLSQWIYWGE